MSSPMTVHSQNQSEERPISWKELERLLFGKESEERLLSRKELSDRWDVSIKTLKRREKAGELRALSLSTNCVRYRLSEIMEIEREAESTAA